MIPASLLHLTRLAGLPDPDLTDVDIAASDPVFPTRYRMTEAGAVSMAATGLAASALWALRTGRRQRVAVNGRAATAALRSNHYLKIDGASPPRPKDQVTGFYRVRDGRWIYLHCNFSNLRDRNIGVLGAPPERQAVAAKAAQWDGVMLEDAIFAAGGCCAFIRSEAEWDATPQAAVVARLPLLEILRIGDAPPEPLPQGDRPLSGIRVLDLTRVLAGPTGARAMAEHGADVMKVARPDLPDSGMFDLDTGLGKLSTYLDFRQPAQAETLRTLIRQGDVFSQSYRPGALASHGFGPEDLVRLRPGIVYVTLSAWGHEGPWRNRRGYDTVVQSANGMAFTGADSQPAFLPASPQDYVAGYLMAYGAMVALARRAREGGSWMVRLSLAGAGHWIRSLGPVDPADGVAELPADELQSYMIDSASPVGRLTHLAPVVQMSETPARWARPAVPLGTSAPVWP
jgi:crotonobetainyl-CoA:carnitine CoA-transferase CaiB-like acyl-CoA transferase